MNEVWTHTLTTCCMTVTTMATSKYFAAPIMLRLM